MSDGFDDIMGYFPDDLPNVTSKRAPDRGGADADVEEVLGDLGFASREVKVEVKHSRGLPPAGKMLEDILHLRGWDLRAGQADMVDIIHENWTAAGISSTVVRAPVGTGKSLAYLVAMLASDARGVVCTSTIALQDQLMRSELPRLAKDLKELYDYDLRYAVMKGRGNYPCMSAVKSMIEGKHPDEEDMFGNIVAELQDDDLRGLREIHDRGQAALESEDTAQLTAEHLINALPQGASSLIRATRVCGDRSRRWWEEVEDAEPGDETRIARPLEELLSESGCVYRTAYIRAMMADIVVMNTSLLAAELMKSRVSGPLTPQQLTGTAYVVVDEGHHLTRILTDALREDLDLFSIQSDVDTMFRRLIRRNPAAEKMLSNGATAVREIAGKMMEVIKDNPHDRQRRGPIAATLYELAADISNMVTGAHRGEDNVPVDNPDTLKAIEKIVRQVNEDIVNKLREVATCVGQKNEEGELSFDLTPSYKSPDEGGPVYPTLHLIPIDLTFFRSELGDVNTRNNAYLEASDLDRLPPSATNLVMCSGTITAESGTVVGVEEDDLHFEAVASPFDPLRSRIYVPNIVYPTDYDNWWSQSWKVVQECIHAVGGRTLFLTTSNLALETFARWCEEDISDKYQILYQGNGMSRDQVVSEFQRDETSVLVGTTSYWEGVDVPGPACSLVIVDKIPFPMRDDPVFNARRKYVERRGGNPFQKVDVDHASTMLAQGFGRLLRSEDDLGGLMLLDHRVMDKPYGTSLMRQIPGRTPITDKKEPFLEWLRWVNPDNPDVSDDDDIPDVDRRVWRPLRVGRRRRVV